MVDIIFHVGAYNISNDTFLGEKKMDTEGSFPIGFSMALAHNVSSFNAFLSLDDNEQNEIISKARSVKTKREMQILVDNIPTIKRNKLS